VNLPSADDLKNLTAFVDTTVLTDALLKQGDLGDAARSALRRFRETELPVYAIKEFKAGPFAHYIWLYNKFASQRSLSRVIAAIQSMYRRPRQISTALEAMTSITSQLGKQRLSTLAAKYGSNCTQDSVQSDEMKLALKAVIYKAWRNRKKVVTRVVCPLSCYDEGDIVEERGLLVLQPHGCTLEPDCCMRPDLVASTAKLEKLRDVAGKGTREEDRRRYQALRGLCRVPKRPLSRKDCIYLGDAIFAFFAPPKSVILTTNVKDHEPLAGALGKKVVHPKDQP
jgi:hypothetical protein